MRVVILVGAGATLADALPSRPAKAATPPLDVTFFQLSEAADLDGRTTLQRYMTRSYGIDPFSGYFGMEEVFNLLYSDAQLDPPPPNCLDAYRSLVTMYQDAIRLTTNPLRGNSRRGIGAIIRTIVNKWPDAELTFVTFNHDLVIEKALDEMVGYKSYENLQWDFHQAYLVEFSDIVTLASGSRPFRTASQQSLFPNPIRVLKLHGSMNWVYRVRSANDAKNALRQPTGDLFCVNDQRIFKELTMPGRKRPYHLFPLIVPPVYEKSNQLRGILAPVWKAARDAIASASRLVVFGYSFPTADIAARSMVRRAYFANRPLSDIKVIDVDPDVAATAAKHLDAPTVGFVRSARDLPSVLAAA